MEKLHTLFDGLASDPEAAPQTIALTLLLSFCLGQLVAWVYLWTHEGMSYSRSFTQSLLLITMVVSLVMLIIGESITTAFGLMGALAIIRFRNVLKDTRDTVFVLFTLVIGMSVGTQKHGIAILGALALVIVQLYLRITRFGSRGHFDAHLSLWLSPETETSPVFPGILRAFCAGVHEMSRRVGGAEGVVECIYQVKLRDRRRHLELVESLRALGGVDEVALVLRDELAEL